jgi:diguanylate cyclase (GGDEF)-like protein
MDKTENSALNQLVNIDILSDSSLFSVKIVDLETFEVIYANQSMKAIMADENATNCWESVYAQSSPCKWCKVHEFPTHKTSALDADSITYEHFNEVANKWYQLHEKIIRTEKGRKLLISFALDISMQKEAQSKLINAHVQLSHQTKALKEAQKALKEQASHDYLTNLYNRRYFQHISQDLINIAKREAVGLSIIMLDIDKFKIVNDTYGHRSGDLVLKHIASILTEHTRDSDIVARIGGEEFAILLLHTAKKGAAVIAEKLRESVENHPATIDNKTNISVTISLGVALVEVEHDINIDLALNNADTALYEAKRSGRNKVIMHSV